MKAYKVIDGGGLENLKIHDASLQDPKENQVKIKWHATTLNYHDYLVAIGAIKVEEGRIPMSDGAGEVVEVGAGVTRFKKGDKVMSLFFPNWVEGRATLSKIKAISGESVDGYMCEYSCLNENTLTLMPQGMSYAEAACLPTAGLTAWNALFENGKIGLGDSVLIEGTGGMSLCAAIFARHAGVDIYGTTSSEEKAKKLVDWGFKSVVNYKKDENWGKSINKITGGVDQVIDVGGGSTMKQSIEACKLGGHIHSIGILGAGRKGEITFPKLFFKFIKLEGLAVGSRKMQEDMVKAIESQGIDFSNLVDRRFAFSELKAAFDYQAQGKHMGKIVIEYR